MGGRVGKRMRVRGRARGSVFRVDWVGFGVMPSLTCAALGWEEKIGLCWAGG